MSPIFRVFFITSVLSSAYCESLKKLQNSHRPQELSNSDLNYLSNLSDVGHMDQILDKILIPRVVGTPNHEKVFNYIKKELENFNYEVEIDEFDEKTPVFGVLKFKNIVAKLNPNADRYLALACHYDSKFFKNEEFVGATDSAVPCAMLLNLAKVMQNDLNSIKDRTDISLKLIFFDGEEAFENWGPKDSIYGARHLAKMLHNKKSQSRKFGEQITDLQKMDMLVLLDLIGHSTPSFYSCFQNTEKWYVRMVNLESRLQNLGLIKKRQNVDYFRKSASYGGIEDDHIPFLRKGLPILHLISQPFPEEWHTIDDNRNIVDLQTTENINKILRCFVAEYLHINLGNEENQEKPEKPEKEL